MTVLDEGKVAREPEGYDEQVSEDVAFDVFDEVIGERGEEDGVVLGNQSPSVA